MELEVKLSFDSRDLLYGLADSGDFLKYCSDAVKPEPVLLENTYLDTSDMKITGRGGMIRIRHCKGSDKDNFEFTVKYGGGVSEGYHKRYEWNVESEDGKFSIESFKSLASSSDDPSDMLSEVFSGIKDEDLYPLCSNSFNRTVYNLTYGDSTIEACFDYGLISNTDGSKTDEICELELELKTGDPSDIAQLAKIITDKTGCVPLDNTKYGRTLKLARGTDHE